MMAARRCSWPPAAVYEDSQHALSPCTMPISQHSVSTNRLSIFPSSPSLTPTTQDICYRSSLQQHYITPPQSLRNRKNPPSNHSHAPRQHPPPLHPHLPRQRPNHHHHHRRRHPPPRRSRHHIPHPHPRRRAHPSPRLALQIPHLGHRPTRVLLRIPSPHVRHPGLHPHRDPGRPNRLPELGARRRGGTELARRVADELSQLLLEHWGCGGEHCEQGF
ncbi:hypothetical protein BDR22DRAFT_510740 [Usnea florida]